MSQLPFLAGALARRLTHDLAGPLTAIVTLAEMSPDPDPLLAEAIQQARARLGLARLLFGGAPDSPFDHGELVALLTAHLADKQQSLRVSLPAPGQRARGLLALCLAASDCLMGPGAITATTDQVVAEGRTSGLSVALVEALATGHTADPAHVPAAFAAALMGPLVAVPTNRGLAFSAAAA